MRAFDGVPLLMEEDPEYAMIPMPDSAWCNYDTLISRHLIPLGTTRNGWANIGFTDSHVSRVQWPKCPAIGNPFYFSNLMSPYYIEAFYCCIRTSGRKWVSGRSSYDWRYGSLDTATASDSILH